MKRDDPAAPLRPAPRLRLPDRALVRRPEPADRADHDQHLLPAELDQPAPRLRLGRAVRKAVDAWDTDQTVAFATSGGLSHFVVDEELDRMALKGLETADGEILRTLPRHRLQSATTETLNWVAIAGAMGGTPMETIAYEPGYRTPAGTGCGCAVGHWATNGH